MTSRDAPLRFLAQLAAKGGEPAATAWRELGNTAYRGDIGIATGNSTYRFRDGVFVSRAKRPQTFFDSPRSMHGLLLVGFLSEDDARDRWVHAVAWRAGSHAVFWRTTGVDATCFVLTSPTSSFDLEPSPWIDPRLIAHPGTIEKVPRRIARPPSLRVPAAPSMTRLHHATPHPPDRALID